MTSARPSEKQLQEGTSAATYLPPTEMLSRIEQSFTAWCNVFGIKFTFPRPLSFEEKKDLYRYQPPTKDRYPPHLDVIPTQDQVSQYEIFDRMGLIQAATLIPNIIPKDLVSGVASDITHRFREWMFGRPEQGLTIAEIEHQNKVNRKSATDVMRGANIGDFTDWYTDARFAQQYLTGSNPTTIQLLSDKLLAEFKQAAEDQQLKHMTKILEDQNKSSLYVADCSYFREALGVKPNDPLILNPNDKEDPPRYGCASVTLFQLHDDGNLHPLAIVIDYKGSMRKSVTLFNRRLTPADHTPGEYWPWRYAKTCAQSSDWTLHEIAVHLVNTHFIEEAIIVATHRCIPVDSIIFQLLEPHWVRTLSLNAVARETLVPKVVFALVGYGEDQGYNFIQHAYHNFDFQGKYVPQDLEDRGFPVDDLDSPRFRNYAYARNIMLMWQTIRNFISSMISLHYKSDAQIAHDKHIKEWCQEIQSDERGQIKTFPTINTVDQLVDAITMCIHIASPQHTAINYLQAFYQTFVINKPPCLFQPLPDTLTSLQSISEPFLVKSLPIGHQRHWFLASHISWLLSFRPSDDNNLINYAASLYNLYRKKGDNEKGPQVTDIARTFYEDLYKLIDTFEQQSQQMGEKERQIPYRVLDPREAAVSILI